MLILQIVIIKEPTAFDVSCKSVMVCAMPGAKIEDPSGLEGC
jgi:hypothetical protein